MPTNFCSKCGQEFETKNPKRIVCPNCLYLDRAAAPSVAPVRREPEPEPPQQGGYGQAPQGYGRPPQEGYGPPRQDNYGPPRQGGYGPPRQGGGGYGPPRQGGYGPPRQGGGGYGPPRQGGYGPPRQGGGGYGPPRQGGYGPPRQGGGGYGPPRQGGYGPPRQGGFGGPRRGPGGPPRGGPPRKLLIPKEALIEIENRYKALLPLPNPDAHVVIGEAIGLPPNKVFFGINLVRQKMRLPKLEYPKRPLAVTPDQLEAVKALYEPFLPLPPIGVHKIISKQLRMDEWRVHVAIGLLRKQLGLGRWNEDREDLPPQMKEQIKAAQEAKAKADEEAAKQKEKEEKAKDKDKPAKKTARSKKEKEDDKDADATDEA